MRSGAPDSGTARVGKQTGAVLEAGAPVLGRAGVREPRPVRNHLLRISSSAAKPQPNRFEPRISRMARMQKETNPCHPRHPWSTSCRKEHNGRSLPHRKIRSPNSRSVAMVTPGIVGPGRWPDEKTGATPSPGAATLRSGAARVPGGGPKAPPRRPNGRNRHRIRPSARRVSHFCSSLRRPANCPRHLPHWIRHLPHWIRHLPHWIRHSAQWIHHLAVIGEAFCHSLSRLRN
jgi:hypothetical protein